MNTRKKGDKGELIAKTYLEEKGFHYIESNFYAGNSGEIDLIMSHKGFIVFVEVKSLSINSHYTIFESLTKAKKRRLKYSINKWLLKKNKIGSDWRLDFVGIELNTDKTVENIEHFEFVGL